MADRDGGTSGKIGLSYHKKNPSLGIDMLDPIFELYFKPIYSMEPSNFEDLCRGPLSKIRPRLGKKKHVFDAMCHEDIMSLSYFPRLFHVSSNQLKTS